MTPATLQRQITGREFIVLLAQADSARRPIKKRRRVFLWANQYFEWDIFVDSSPGLELLVVELDTLDASVEMPSFLDIEREVTDDPAFNNHAIARIM
jgi:CYTH domain-containing protein